MAKVHIKSHFILPRNGAAVPPRRLIQLPRRITCSTCEETVLVRDQEGSYSVGHRRVS